MNKSFDLIVIGTGEAGAPVALRCRTAGWRVAIVDCRPFGGTCGQRGCDPKKVLVGAAQAVDWTRRLQGKGLTHDTQIDWPALIRFKRTFTDPFPAAREGSFLKAGIETIHGTARFVSKTSIQVGDDVLESKSIVVATGAWPAALNIPGEEHLTHSDQFMDLPELPERIVFVGGGYIAFEFAHVAARAGSAVTILHQGQRPLERFDPDLVARLLVRTRALGIDVRTNTKVVGVQRSSGHLIVTASADSNQERFETDLAVHAAGRAPDLADLDLSAAGVESSRRGVTVNEYLQSVSNPVVYAAGDAANGGGLPDTPVAGYEGDLVAQNLLNGNKRVANFLGVASVVYTIPALGRVGLTEEEAQHQGLNFRVNQGDTSSWYSARRVAEPTSGYKVLVEKGSDIILGAHLIGPEADELTNVFALAIRARLPVEVLKETLFVYPTQASNIQYML
jgi:glutathione reductase (NADPH)